MRVEFVEILREEKDGLPVRGEIVGRSPGPPNAGHGVEIMVKGIGKGRAH